jgi:hypothetical protein
MAVTPSVSAEVFNEHIHKYHLYGLWEQEDGVEPVPAPVPIPESTVNACT